MERTSHRLIALCLLAACSSNPGGAGTDSGSNGNADMGGARRDGGPGGNVDMGGPGCIRGPTGNGWMYTDVHYMSAAVSSGVSGIWFRDTTHGVIADQTPGFTDHPTPGALFRATGPVTVDDTTPIFDGMHNAYTTATSRPVAVLGLLPDPTGAIVALTNLQVHLASADMGQTFPLVSSGLDSTTVTPMLSIGFPVWISSFTGGWIAVDGYAQVFRTTATTLSMAAPWTAHHSPQTMAGGPQCMSLGSAGAAWTSRDGQTVLLTESSGIGDQVCRSTTGGGAYADVALPMPPPGAAGGAIGFLVFDADGTHGILGGSSSTGGPYAYTTANSGTAWTKSTIPTGMFGATMSSPMTAFYGDAMHVWIVGNTRVGTSFEPLLWASTDGGHTFTDTSMPLHDALASVFGGYVMTPTDPVGVERFIPGAGFALANNHDIWVGGLMEWYDPCQGGAQTIGFLMYSGTGGM